MGNEREFANTVPQRGLLFVAMLSEHLTASYQDSNLFYEHPPHLSQLICSRKNKKNVMPKFLSFLL